MSPPHKQIKMKIIAFLLCNLIYAQDAHWIYYYSSGAVKDEAYYKNEQLHGPWKTFYESGNLAIEGYFNEGLYTGEWKLYYENGALKARGFFDDSDQKLYDGYCIYYYHNGQKMSEGPFIDGLEHGFWKMYYPSGQIAVKSIWEYGIQVSYTNYTDKV